MESEQDQSDNDTTERDSIIVSNQLQNFVTNLGPVIRHELLEGRDYTVVPMVMLTEGVHAGSNGPLYYPSHELSKTPVVWNHKPIVVYHPTMNGQAVSACEPAIISKRKVGLIMNTKYVSGKKGQPGKLQAEAWLETNRLKEVDDRVWNSLQKKEMVEVSTGLFTDNEQVEGLWKKERYNSIARNYRPDHLAILPDEVGACSIQDGAGLLRNSNSQGAAMDKKKLVDGLIQNKITRWEENDRSFLMGLEDMALEKMSPILSNMTNNKNPAETITDGKNDDQSETIKDGAGQVAPKKGGKKVGVESSNKSKKEEEGDEDEDDMEMNCAKTAEEYIANAPSGMRDVLQSALHSHNREKGRLIKTITANKANVFTEDYLLERNLQELEGIAALASASAPETNRRAILNYAGQGDVQGSRIVDNHEEESLPLPTLNFSKAD